MEEFLNEILEIIRSNKSNEEKRQALSQYHDNDIADVLNKLEDQEKIALVKILGKERLLNDKQDKYRRLIINNKKCSFNILL